MFINSVTNKLKGIIMAVKSKCPFLVRRELQGKIISWCVQFNGICEDISNCEFKKKGK